MATNLCQTSDLMTIMMLFGSSKSVPIWIWPKGGHTKQTSVYRARFQQDQPTISYVYRGVLTIPWQMMAGKRRFKTCWIPMPDPSVLKEDKPLTKVSGCGLCTSPYWQYMHARSAKLSLYGRSLSVGKAVSRQLVKVYGQLKNGATYCQDKDSFVCTFPSKEIFRQTLVDFSNYTFSRLL